jgi:hypothetical protein
MYSEKKCHCHKYYYEDDEDIDMDKLNELNIMFTMNIPSQNIENAINDLIPVPSILINEDTDDCCLLLLNLLKIQMDKIILLESKICKNSFTLKDTIKTSVKTVLNMAYVKYILKYGVPDDGVYNPILLAEFEE